MAERYAVQTNNIFDLLPPVDDAPRKRQPKKKAAEEKKAAPKPAPKKKAAKVESVDGFERQPDRRNNSGRGNGGRSGGRGNNRAGRGNSRNRGGGRGGGRGRGRGREDEFKGRSQGGQRRQYDKRSGTGRGKDGKKGGAGKGNWGKAIDDEVRAADFGVDKRPEKKEDEVEGEAGDEIPYEQLMTFDEYKSKQQQSAQQSKHQLPSKRQAGEGVDESWNNTVVMKKKTENGNDAPRVSKNARKKQQRNAKAQGAKKNVALTDFVTVKDPRDRNNGGGRGRRRRGRGNRGNQNGQQQKFNQSSAPSLDEASFPALS